MKLVGKIESTNHDVRMLEFGLDHNMAAGDVQQMIDVGVIAIVGGPGHEEIQWQNGLDAKTGPAAYRSILRCQNKKPWYQSLPSYTRAP